MNTLLFILSFFLLDGYVGQKNIYLNTPDTESKIYEARDEIRLLTGYSFSSKVNKTMRARINSRILVPAAYQSVENLPDPSRSLDTNMPVGSTSGETSVSPSGAGLYNIPIQVPEGVGGIQPGIIVSYNSQMGNGLLGYRWNISGSSAIMRRNKNFYYDNNNMAPVLDNSDALALDGMPLILKSGENLREGATYGFEAETYQLLSIQKVNSLLGFIVKTPDGKTLEYGLTADSNVKDRDNTATVCWLLSRVTDRFGNYMSYSYEKNESTGEFYLKWIDYTGNTTAGTEPANRVEFFYETRSDKIISYVAGEPVAQNRLLKIIKSKIGDTVLREYRFNYFYDGYYSKLTEVLEFGESGTRFNSTIIDWAEEDPNVIREGRAYVSPLSKENKGSQIINADFNGDGKCDFYTVYVDDRGLVGETYLSVMKDDKITFEKDFTFLFGKKTGSIEAADFSGNGRLDFVFFEELEYNTRCSYFLATSKTYEVSSYVYPGKGTIIGDFNGDGKSEVLIKSTQKVYNHLGNEIASEGIDNWGKPYTYYFPSNCYLSDFNGNGKTDILVMDENNAWVYELNGSQFERLYGYSTNILNNRKLVYFGDFNGDGKTDIVVDGGSSISYKLLISNGNGFEVSEIENTGIMYHDDLEVGDVNGDGKMELFFAFKDRNTRIWKIKVCQYDGIAFNKREYILRGFQENSVAVGTPYAYADFDGDGCVEYCYTGNPSEVYIRTFDSPQNLLVRNIIDGINTKVSFDYKPITDNTVYDNVDNISFYPLNKYQIPLYVVSGLNKFSNEGSVKESLAYHYYDICIHNGGKGFRCFRKIDYLDFKKDRMTTTNYTINSSFLEPYVDRVALKTLTDAPISETQYFYNFKSISKKYYSQQLYKTIYKDNVTYTTKTSEYSGYEYGIPTQTVTTYSDGINETSKQTFFHSTSSDNYLLGIPLSLETTLTAGTTPQISKLTFQYDNRFRLEKKFSFVESSQRKISEENYQYDLFGHIINTTKKSYDSTNEVMESCTYSSDGALLKSSTDVMGFTTTYEYDKQNRLVRKVDHKGRSVVYKYDKMGSNILTMLPDGVEHRVSVQWHLINDNIYLLEKSKTGEPTSRMLFNCLGQETQRITTLFDGGESRISTVYNTKGLINGVSLPYKGESAALWNDYTYDQFDRLVDLTEASGKKTTYSYSGRSVSEVKNGIAATKYYNSIGQLNSVTDPGGTIEYTLRADGQATAIVAPGNVVTTLTYDEYGRRSSISDPSAGLQTSEYDPDGNLSKQVDANGHITTMQYDRFGRLVTKTTPEMTVTNSYDDDGFLTAVNSSNGTSSSFMYDNLGRLVREKETGPDNLFLQRDYTYEKGIQSSMAYFTPDGLVAIENYEYANGYLKAIRLNNKDVIWELKSENEFGQPTRVTTGGLNRCYNYTSFGLLKSRIVDYNGAVRQEQHYRFDESTGNLLDRATGSPLRTEAFAYDYLNRLTGSSDHVVSYASNGNILSKSNVGEFNYGHLTKPYAITQLAPVSEGIIPVSEQSVTYNSMQRPVTISNREYSAEFVYNASGDRVKMTVSKGIKHLLDRHYLMGQYEKDNSLGKSVEKLYLAGDYYTSPAVYVKNEGVWSLHYILRDYLGSVTHIVDASGRIEQSLSYDAWGRLRDPKTLVVYDCNHQPTLLYGRGYTGHEHLPWFGLINMNARLYDPVSGRFLSPDPYIQASDYTQNYNRYTYCLNNPLLYTDQSGEFWNLIIGAAIGGISNWLMNGAEFSWKGLGYFGVGAVSGALGAGIGGGVSSAIGGGAFNAGFLGLEAAKVATTSFISGAAIGGASGFAGGFVSGLGNGLLGGKRFDDALLKGTLSGTFGGLSGGFVGGLIGGIDALIDGRSFGDGSNVIENVIVDKGLPYIRQDGKMDCGPANIESLTKRKISQQDIRDSFKGTDKDRDGLLINEVFDKLTENTGRKFEMTKGIMPSEYSELLKTGYDISFNLKTGTNVGHLVTLNKIVLQVKIKPSGRIIQQMLYYVMDPARGRYSGIGLNELYNSHIRVLMYP